MKSYPDVAQSYAITRSRLDNLLVQEPNTQESHASAWTFAMVCSDIYSCHGAFTVSEPSQNDH